MVEFKMAAIIKLRENECILVWLISLSQSFVQNGWTQDGRIQDGCLHQVESEWMSEFFCAKWLNARRQNSRWLPSSSYVRRNEFESDWISLSQSFVQNGWMQDGKIQDGHHHQVESEWMSEVFFVQNGWMQEGRIQDGCHHQVDWEWMTLSQIELVWVRVLCKMAESKMAQLKMAEFKMPAMIKLYEKEWVWVSLN